MNSRSNLEKFGIPILVAVVLLIAGVFYYRTTFISLGTTPKNNAKNVDELSPVSFNFNQPMTSPSLTNTTAPNYLLITPAASGKVAANGHKIIFTPTDPLAVNTTYSFQLNNVTNKTGGRLKSINLTFTTGYTPWNRLPVAVQQQYLNQTDGEPSVSAPKQKLINSLPVVKADFSIDYTGENDTFSIAISAAPVAKSEQEALDYMKSVGVDPSGEHISFFIQPTAR